MNFNTESSYITVEQLFDEPEVFILAEINEENTDNADQLEKLKNAVAAEYFGKGICISSAKWLGPPEPGDENDVSNIGVRIDGVDYYFCAQDILAIYPRIEGSFHPGIYKENFSFYKIETIRDLSEMFADLHGWSMPDAKYKLICRRDAVDIILFRGKRENHSLTIPIYPLTYLDLFCPVCNKQIIFCKEIDNISSRCFYEIDKCSHYLGTCMKINGKYLPESLDGIECEYRFEDEEILVATVDGWQKPHVFIPPYNPMISHWGKSFNEESDDVFLFFR